MAGTTTPHIVEYPTTGGTVQDIREEYDELDGVLRQHLRKHDRLGGSVGVEHWQAIGLIAAQLSEVARRMIIKLREEAYRTAATAFAEAAYKHALPLTPYVQILFMAGRMEEAAANYITLCQQEIQRLAGGLAGGDDPENEAEHCRHMIALATAVINARAEQGQPVFPKREQ